MTHGNKFESLEGENNFWAKYKWLHWLNKQGKKTKMKPKIIQELGKVIKELPFKKESVSDGFIAF